MAHLEKKKTNIRKYNFLSNIPSLSNVLTFCFLIFWQEVAETFHAENAVRKIKGIGFDATCSLVALNSSGDPVTVSPSREACRNVILWLDHRAIDQAKRINDTHHQVLSYVGGAISPEMAAPKLLWLKEHLRDCCWEKCDLFLDLPEFLTYRATKDPARYVGITSSVGCVYIGGRTICIKTYMVIWI